MYVYECFHLIQYTCVANCIKTQANKNLNVYMYQYMYVYTCLTHINVINFVNVYFILLEKL